MTQTPPTTDGFMELSEALTGICGIGDHQAVENAQLISSVVGADQLQALVDAFASVKPDDADRDASIRARIMDDSQLGPLARAVITLWYTGVFTSPGGQTPEQIDAAHHFSALIWPTVGAHPPGLSGGYFGYWAYPAEG